MKNIKEWAIVALTIICLTLATGWFLDNDHYNIVDKQDELAVMFNNVQSLMNTAILNVQETEIKIQTLKEMNTLNDNEVEILKNFLTSIPLLKQEISERKIALIQLQFAYSVLQEMR